MDMTNGTDMTEIRSSSHRATNRKVFDLITGRGVQGKRILDIGAGKGYMAKLLGDHIKASGGVPAEALSACDLYPEYFLYQEVPCERMAFVSELPYPEGAFDVVYAIEVIEHLRNPYDFISEMFRVLKPGGMAIITTPNILNLSSRMTYLLCGFFELFGPLSSDARDARRTWGHIMPLSAYYLAHAMKMTGFTQATMHADRLKRSSLALFLLMWPVLKLSMHLYVRRLRRRKPVVFRENEQDLQAVSGLTACCSRSVVLVGEK